MMRADDGPRVIDRGLSRRAGTGVAVARAVVSAGTPQAVEFPFEFRLLLTQLLAGALMEDLCRGQIPQRQQHHPAHHQQDGDPVQSERQGGLAEEGEQITQGDEGADEDHQAADLQSSAELPAGVQAGERVIVVGGLTIAPLKPAQAQADGGEDRAGTHGG